MKLRPAILNSFAFILLAETVALGQVIGQAMGKQASGPTEPLVMEAHEDVKYESLNRDQALWGPPLALSEVIDALKSTYPAYVVKFVTNRWVNFDITPEIEKRLRKAKADDKLVEIIRKVGPTVRAQNEFTPGVRKVPAAEHAAYDALNNESNPDQAIHLAASFEKKFPDSTILTLVYYLAANAYQQKGDIPNSVVYLEKSIKLNQDNVSSLLLLAARIPSPPFLKNHGGEEEKYLGDAQGYAEGVLKVYSDPKVLPRNVNETDQQYARRKEAVACDAHGSLGMIHLQRAQLGLLEVDQAELATAEKEYQQAIATAEQPKAEYFYRLGEAYSLAGKQDEGIAAFTKASEFGLKAYADPRIEDLKKQRAESQLHSKP